MLICLASGLVTPFVACINTNDCHINIIMYVRRLTEWMNWQELCHGWRISECCCQLSPSCLLQCRTWWQSLAGLELSLLNRAHHLHVVHTSFHSPHDTQMHSDISLQSHVLNWIMNMSDLNRKIRLVLRYLIMLTYEIFLRWTLGLRPNVY